MDELEVLARIIGYLLSNYPIQVDLGMALVSRTCALTFYLSSRTLSLGPVPYGLDLWTVGPGIDLRILIPCLGGIVSARVWVYWSRFRSVLETSEWLELLGPVPGRAT